VLAKALHGARRPGILAIADGIAEIRVEQRSYDLRRYRRIVIAPK